MLYAWQYAGLLMNNFNLHILSSNQQQSFPNVCSFVGVDASGSFGIQANHAHFMTVLAQGLSRFRLDNETWHYLALPSGLASFRANQLTISTRFFLIDTDFDRISDLLEQQAAKEQESRQAIRDSLQQMEWAILKKVKNLKHDLQWE